MRCSTKRRSCVLPIEWLASADADLMEILDYISDRNEQAADRLYSLISGSLETASEHPYIFKPSLRVAGTREIVVHPNYIVFYHVTESQIQVVNVVHARQQFPKGNWGSR